MALQVSCLGLDCLKCTEADKINNGCTRPPEDPSRWIFENESLKRCPLRLIRHESFLLLKYYSFYKEGYLVNKGALGHQPAKMIEAFSVIDSEIEKIRKERKEEV